MDNVLQTNGVPLTVFGGAVPELAPEDLPEGASPFNQDCDFNPGSVFTRGGRQNQYSYLNQIFTANPAVGKTLPGAFAPTEIAWTTPQNIQNDTPGQYAIAQVNQGLNVTMIVQYRQQQFNTPTQVFTAAFNAPVTAGNCVIIAVFVDDPNGSTEGVNLTAMIDNKSQAATRIISNSSHTAQNLCSFIISQSQAVGGNQTYTFTITKNAGGTITASAYTVTLIEVQGTSNAGGTDPTDQMNAANAGNGAGSNTTLTVNTAGPNELLLAVAQSNNANTPSSFLLPGTGPHGGHSNIYFVSDQLSNGTPFIENAFYAQFLATNPNAILPLNSTGVNTVNQAVVWVTLKMTNAFGAGSLGILSTGVDVTGNTTFNTGGGPSSVTLPTLTTTQPNECIVYIVNLGAGSNFTTGNYPPAPLGFLYGQSLQGYFFAQVAATAGTYVPPTIPTVAAAQYTACAFSLQINGTAPPTPIQDFGGVGNIPTGNTTILTNFANLTAGNSILVVVTFQAANNFTPPSGISFTNSVGDVFQQIASVITTIGGTQYYGNFVYLAQNIVGGNNDIVMHNVSGASYFGGVETLEIKGGIAPVPPTPHSQILQGAGYFSIPGGNIPVGLEVLVSGHQNTLDPASIISVSLNQPGTKTLTAQLPLSDGTVIVGGPLEQWGLQPPLSNAMINNRSFAVNVVASTTNLFATPTFSIYGVQVKLFTTPNPASNFNWIKSYEQTDAEVDTLALDATGVLWDEDVDSNPAVLNNIFNTILPNTFAKSVTFADIEYIAFSNLVNGTDVPRQWNGQFLDRISMVGPGAALNASSAGGAGGSNLTPIQSIKQAAPVAIRRISWGASINAQSDSTPGNVLVVSLPGGSTHGGNPALNMNPNDTIQLQNITNPFPLKGGGSLPYNLNTAGPLNGYYTLLSSGTPIIGGGETDTAFTLQAPAIQYGYSNDFGVPPSSGWTYQDCVATITLQSPIPNVGVGSSIQIAGTGGPPAGYDGTWTILSSPNASAMTISSVILVGGVATYTYTLIPGSASPTVGALVTTANVLNGNPAGPPGIFNVSNVAIQSIGAGTFSINISNADITPSQPQTGVPQATAQIAGTIFTFDPQQIITGYSGGGNVVQQGLVAVGQRKVCYCFLTRSGFITQPSPLYTFNVTSGSGTINVTGLATGPPNVVARIVCFTGAGGGNFFYIPQEVDITIPGQPVQKNTSTIVNDNVSTQASFSFSDAVLLSAIAIDITGNNLFNCIELGSCRGLLTYSDRMIAWSEQTKVTNFRNLSFDGGQTNTGQPLGWTVAGLGGSVNTNSPVFAWAYQIINASGVNQASYGMITQGAWQDEFGVPIIQASTLYSVRICASVSPPQSTGNLIVDLFSSLVGGGTALGTFSLPLASMTTTMQIYTGTLLTVALPNPTPKDLLLRIWANNVSNCTITIDHVEPFQTLTPVLSTAFKCSYVNNQESFDLVTGVCGPAQNMQPVNGGMVLFDLLYALKEKSWYSTFDNGVTEPNQWNWKEVSNKVGTIGIHSYDWGEGWALTGNRQGVFFFEGGEPIKVSQEIQPVWDAINWQYGYTIWVRNDPEQRRFTVGIPIATPNQWMPEFPVNANPTSPNVILMCNYRELNSGAALAQTGPIRSTYTGRLMSPEPARKWSFWNIACPYSDYIDRANNQWPQWFCTGYQDSKVFQLLASQLSDDGNAINSFWVSYGFVKPEAADAKGLGLFRMEFPYFTVLAVGSGSLNTYVYPESPFNPPYALDQMPLPTTSQGDLEIGVNIKGQRFFVRVGTNAVGAAFRCSKMVVPLIPDTWAPVRGYNVITA